MVPKFYSLLLILVLRVKNAELYLNYHQIWYWWDLRNSKWIIKVVFTWNYTKQKALQRNIKYSESSLCITAALSNLLTTCGEWSFICGKWFSFLIFKIFWKNLLLCIASTIFSLSILMAVFGFVDFCQLIAVWYK